MNKMERRKFIFQSTLAMGTLSFSGKSPLVSGSMQPPDPDPSYLCEEVKLWKEGSKNNGSNVNYIPRIRIYHPVFLPKPTKKFAAVLVCPGGGYYVQAPHEGLPFARLFSLYGIVGVVLTYRVNPDRYPAAYSDATRAMRILRRDAGKYNIDPDKIGIMGFSAGGHLASTVAVQPELFKNPEDDLVSKFSARPDRVILGYPVISFIDNFTHSGSAKSLLGENPDPAMLKQLTNYLHITPQSPPAFLFHNADDEGVPAENSLRYAEACIKNKVPVELQVYPRGGHGVGMATELPGLKNWTLDLMNWLDEWIYKA
jgi:acetyl esterase/lipase